MDLLFPLASVSPGLDSAALTVLAGADTAMSATQIQRVAGRGSRYGLVLVLERLTEHGLVLAIPAARGNLYQLNRDHVLAPFIESIVTARTMVYDRVADMSQCLIPTPNSVAIFGSVARGDATAESDLDLLIIASDTIDVEDETWVNQINALEQQARVWTGNSIQVSTVTSRQLMSMVRAGAPIVDEWERDVKTIMGEDARSLIRAARKEVL